jgi:hypothetical protein
MANAYKDENSVSTLIACSTADGTTPVRLYANPSTHRLLVSVTGTVNATVSPQSTSPVSPAASDSGTYFTNEGAAGLITFNLPVAVAGYIYTFIVENVNGIAITAFAGDTIRFGGTVTATGGTITSTTIGSTITLVSINATEWIAVSLIGTWA